MTPDIIAAIDQAVGCHTCGDSLEKSVSDLFCCEHCQATWHSSRIGIKLAPTQGIQEYEVRVDLSGFTEAARQAAEATARLAEVLRTEADRSAL